MNYKLKNIPQLHFKTDAHKFDPAVHQGVWEQADYLTQSDFYPLLLQNYLYHLWMAGLESGLSETSTTKYFELVAD